MYRSKAEHNLRMYFLCSIDVAVVSLLYFAIYPVGKDILSEFPIYLRQMFVIFVGVTALSLTISDSVFWSGFGLSFRRLPRGVFRKRYRDAFNNLNVIRMSVAFAVTLLAWYFYAGDPGLLWLTFALLLWVMYVMSAVISNYLFLYFAAR